MTDTSAHEAEPLSLGLAQRCAENGFGYYVVVHLPNVGPYPRVAGPFSRWKAVDRAVSLIEKACPAVYGRLAVSVKVGGSPADFPTVRDSHLLHESPPAGQEVR